MSIGFGILLVCDREGALCSRNLNRMHRILPFAIRRRHQDQLGHVIEHQELLETLRVPLVGAVQREEYLFLAEHFR